MNSVGGGLYVGVEVTLCELNFDFVEDGGCGSITFF